MNATILTGNQIHAARFLALVSALKLETLGMRRRGVSAYAILKREYGFTGSRAKVLEKAEDLKKRLLKN
jgi:hypothetical protein